MKRFSLLFLWTIGSLTLVVVGALGWKMMATKQTMSDVYISHAQQIGQLLVNQTKPELFDQNRDGVKSLLKDQYMSAHMSRIVLTNANGKVLVDTQGQWDASDQPLPAPYVTLVRSGQPHSFLIESQTLSVSVPIAILQNISEPVAGNVVGHLFVQYLNPLGPLYPGIQWIGLLAVGLVFASLIIATGLFWINRSSDPKPEKPAAPSADWLIALYTLSTQPAPAPSSGVTRSVDQLLSFEQTFEELIESFCEIAEKVDQFKSVLPLPTPRIDIKRLDAITKSFINLKSKQIDFMNKTKSLSKKMDEDQHLLQQFREKFADVMSTANQLKKQTVNLAIESTKDTSGEILVTITDDIRNLAELLVQRCVELSFDIHKSVEKIQVYKAPDFRVDLAETPDLDQTSHFWENQKRTYEKSSQNLQQGVEMLGTQLEALQKQLQALSLRSRNALVQFNKVKPEEEKSEPEVSRV